MSFSETTKLLSNLIQESRDAKNSAALHRSAAEKNKLVIFAATQTAIDHVASAQSHAALFGLDLRGKDLPELTQDMTVDELSATLFDLQDEASAMWVTVASHVSQMTSLAATLSEAMNSMLIDAKVPRPSEGTSVPARVEARLPRKLRKKRSEMEITRGGGAMGMIELRSTDNVASTSSAQNRARGADNTGTPELPTPGPAQRVGEPSRDTMDFTEFKKLKNIMRIGRSENAD